MTHGCHSCTLLLIFLVCVRVRACFLCVVSKTIFFSCARQMRSRVHMMALGKNRGERKNFRSWYKPKTICVLYFRFVPSPENCSLAPIFSEGQSKWNRPYHLANKHRDQGPRPKAVEQQRTSFLVSLHFLSPLHVIRLALAHKPD